MIIALAQVNPVVGDIPYNAGKVLEYSTKARNAGADLVVFPELTLTGYPPKDLLLRKEFLDETENWMSRIIPASRDIGILLGTPQRGEKGLYNAAILLQGGRVKGLQYKSLIPYYDVFDETRYFKPAPERRCIDFCGMKLGVTVCEDIWNDKSYWNRRLYDIDPVEELVAQGAKLIINLSASPYHFGKHTLRVDMLGKVAARHGVGIIYVNQVGGNDHLVFDGSSCVVTPKGTVRLQLQSFNEGLAVVDTDALIAAGAALPDSGAAQAAGVEDISWVYEALVLGTRDYLHKNGFTRAVVGLSGGIDSSVTAALAAHALGPANVLGVAMPSRYSSRSSLDDAAQLAGNLDIQFRVIPIESIFQAYIGALNPSGAVMMDLAEENVQARIRGNILMYISNREGHLVLATGNKSEMAMGYSTLYGDMTGGLNVLADVPKVMVYRLAHYINRNGEVIPRSVIDKPPSAELKPDQKDEDSLPPYNVLDEILKAYIEDLRPVNEIAAMGYSRELVAGIARRVNRAEYKRQQAPPGLKVTSRAFGPGRRMPIAHRWHLK